MSLTFKDQIKHALRTGQQLRIRVSLAESVQLDEVDNKKYANYFNRVFIGIYFSSLFLSLIFLASGSDSFSTFSFFGAIFASNNLKEFNLTVQESQEKEPDTIEKEKEKEKGKRENKEIEKEKKEKENERPNVSERNNKFYLIGRGSGLSSKVENYRGPLHTENSWIKKYQVRIIIIIIIAITIITIIATATSSSLLKPSFC